MLSKLLSYEINLFVPFQISDQNRNANAISLTLKITIIYKIMNDLSKLSDINMGYIREKVLLALIFIRPYGLAIDI